MYKLYCDAISLSHPHVKVFVGVFSTSLPPFLIFSSFQGLICFPSVGHVIVPWILCALSCLLVLMSCSDENI